MAGESHLSRADVQFAGPNEQGFQVGYNSGTINIQQSQQIPSDIENDARACEKALFPNNPYMRDLVREALITQKGARTPGTCEWIRQNELYQSWLQSDTQLLWISGSPGKGKTTLSIFLSQEVEEHVRQIPTANLIFYFCSYQDKMYSTADAVLRGLIYQMIKDRANLAKYIQPYIENLNSGLFGFEALWKIFISTLQDPSVGLTFCILDGLDECDEDSLRLLINRLLPLFSLGNPQDAVKGFKLAIVSREIGGMAGCPRLNLDSDSQDAISRDIELFISNGMKELVSIEGLNNDALSYIESQLLQRIEGTFLAVGLIMDDLCRQKNLSKVLDVLERTPEGLYAIYDRMLLQIESSQIEISATILRWVAMSFRPLTLLELADAIDIEDPALSQKHILRKHSVLSKEQAIRDQIASCGSFLKLSGQLVSLLHQSAKEYLLRKDPDDNKILENFRINAEKAHVKLAKACIDYFCQRCFTQDNRLFQYTVLYWPEHARSSAAYANEILDLSSPFFHEKSQLRLKWLLQYNSTINYHQNNMNLGSPLIHIASFFGIHVWVEKLVIKRSFKHYVKRPVNEKDQNGRTALFFAADQGHDGVVRLLIKHGAEVNARDNYGESAIERSRNLTVLQILLENGANLRIDSYTLVKVASKGNEAVVRLLLDRGTDLNARSSGAMISAARISLYETVKMVQLLLGHGAYVNLKYIENMKGAFGNTALVSAAKSGHEKVVKLLLDHGADVNMEAASGNTALVSAAKSGHERVVKLLLDHGANVNMKGAFGNTALVSAAKSGHEKVVKLLLDYGADVNMKAASGNTALVSAAKSGHERVVKLLLDHGANVNMKGAFGNTALISAAKSSYERVMKLLLDHGADVNMEAASGNTALVSAAKSGHERVVKLLLDHGADINIKAASGNTALVSAAKSGHETVVKLLLDNGANMNMKGTFGNTALVSAAKSGHETVVELLLDNGADINIKAASGNTALVSAAKSGHERVVKLLLDYGANINMEGDFRETAIVLAAHNGHEGVVKLLAEHGAER